MDTLGGLKTKITKRLNRSWLPMLRNHLADANSHIWYSEHARPQSTNHARATMISTAALLLLLSHFANKGNKAVQEKAKDNLRDLLQRFGLGAEYEEVKFAAPAEMPVFVCPEYKRTQSSRGRHAAVMISKGIMDCTALVGNAAWTRLANKWKKGLGYQRTRPLLDCLTCCHAKKNLHWFSDQIAHGCAQHIETRFVFLQLEAKPSNDIKWHSRNDPALQLALAENARRKAPRGRKQKMSANLARRSIHNRRKAMTKYWFNQRREFASAKQICLADDGGQAGGRLRLISAVKNLETGITGWGTPIDMRATTYRVEQPGQNVTQEDMDDWKASAWDFLRSAGKREAAEKEDKNHLPKRRKQKMERKSAYDHIVAKDKVLRNLGTQGLRQFQFSEEDLKKNLLDLNVLVNVEDQSSVNCSVDSFEQQILKLIKWAIGDFCHGVWKDVLNAIKGSDCWVEFMLVCVYLNFHEGPWNTQKWWQTIKEAFAEAMSMIKEDSKLLHALLAMIRRDKQNDTLSAKEVLEGLKDAKFLHKMGGGVSPSRWWTWMAEMLERDSEIAEELLLLMFHGITDRHLGAAQGPQRFSFYVFCCFGNRHDFYLS